METVQSKPSSMEYYILLSDFGPDYGNLTAFLDQKSYQYSIVCFSRFPKYICSTWPSTPPRLGGGSPLHISDYIRALKNRPLVDMVRPAGFEPAASGSASRRSIQLSYGRLLVGILYRTVLDYAVSLSLRGRP